MYGKGGGAVINGRTEVKVEVVETEGGGTAHTSLAFSETGSRQLNRRLLQWRSWLSLMTAMCLRCSGNRLDKDKHPDVMCLLLHRHRSSSDLL